MNKYSKEIKWANIYIDVYDVLVAFEVTNPATAHAIKKMLMPGKRGQKSTVEDINEAIISLERAKQIEIDKL